MYPDKMMSVEYRGMGAISRISRIQILGEGRGLTNGSQEDQREKDSVAILLVRTQP